MKRALLALSLALLPQLALASPPSAGSVHTFVDPMFRDTVVCDDLDQVRSIASAAQPEQRFFELFQQMNARNEPTCAAMVPTGVVVDVLPLGRIERDDKHFYAYAVKSDAAGVTFYALYLEFVDMVRA